MNLTGDPWLQLVLIGLGAPVVGAVTMTYLLPLVIRRRQVTKMSRLFQGKLALTYDDGPDNRATPALLDLLERHQAKATFFLVGWRAERHPHICDRIVEAGHEVGCHSHRHTNQWRQWPWETDRDIERAYRAMSQWMPADAPYRPPLGKLTTWGWFALRRRGSVPVWWTLAARDALPPLPDPEVLCREIMENRGGVLLLHVHPHPSRMDCREFVLRLTERVLETARENGIEVCPLFRVLRGGADLSAGQTGLPRKARA